MYPQVIQKLIERVSHERLGFVNSFRGNVYDLSTHPYGCRVLQRCFEHLPEETTRPLMDELHKYMINLMQDQFGVCTYHCQILACWLMSYEELCCSICAGARQASRSESSHHQTSWSDVEYGSSQVCIKRLWEGSRYRWYWGTSYPYRWDHHAEDRWRQPNCVHDEGSICQCVAMFVY